MSRFRFSPIKSRPAFTRALEYIAARVIELAKVTLGEDMALGTITVFAHSDEEYDFLENIIRSYGPESRLTHGETLYVDTDFDIKGNRIRHLGVRKPDEYRPEVGYADMPAANMQDLEFAHIGNKNVNRIKSGLGQTLLELRHPDFDVIGFVVDASEY